MKKCRELPGEPLPCPFCGKQPKVLWTSWIKIKCMTPTCNAPQTPWYGFEFGAMALAQWNKRA